MFTCVQELQNMAECFSLDVVRVQSDDGLRRIFAIMMSHLNMGDALNLSRTNGLNGELVLQSHQLVTLQRRQK